MAYTMNMTMQQLYKDSVIYVKKSEGVTLPQHGSDKAAGYDITAISDPIIIGYRNEGDNSWSSVDYIEYKTGLFIAPQSRLHLHTLIHPRSSISKYNLVLANSIGLIDNDYRGEILCRFKYIWQPEDLVIESNIKGFIHMDKIYKKGDKIAQLIAEFTNFIEFKFVDELDQTERGEGGFGSTDKLKLANPQVPKISEETMKKVTGTLMDKYREAGGIPVKMKYTEEIKQREDQQQQV